MIWQSGFACHFFFFSSHFYFLSYFILFYFIYLFIYLFIVSYIFTWFIYINNSGLCWTFDQNNQPGENFFAFMMYGQKAQTLVGLNNLLSRMLSSLFNIYGRVVCRSHPLLCHRTFFSDFKFMRPRPSRHIFCFVTWFRAPFGGEPMAQFFKKIEKSHYI